MPDLTGIERLLVDCVQELSSVGTVHQTVVVHADQKWVSELPTSVSLQFVDRRFATLARGWKPSGRFDFVHSFGGALAFGTKGLTSYTIHDWGPFREREMPRKARILWMIAILRGALQANQLHFNSQSVRDDAPFGLKPLIRARPSLLGLPAAPQFKPLNSPVERTESTVLSVGTNLPRKRFALLADAATAAGLSLTLAGGRTDEIPGSNHVSVLGRVTDDELRYLYASSKVFALVSTYEGFGLPTLEAWLAGCHLVLTDSVAVRLPPEIVRDAIVVPVAASSREIGRALTRAASLPSTGPRRIATRGTLVSQILALADGGQVGG